MSLATGLRCLHCETPYPRDSILPACPACRTEAFASNVVYEYDYDRLDAQTLRTMLERADRTIWRYRELLPVDPVFAVSLGEGGTPLVAVPAAGRRLGLSRLLAKDESRNPTWSFKDRLCAVAVSQAREVGATGIVAATTGNHGSATAAYAARAGLPCVIFTTTDAPGTVTTLMRAYGARLLAVRTTVDRWRLVAACVERFGWFTTANATVPPAGSPAVGIEGYKTIAYEIAEALDWRAPEVMIVPTSAGDGLIGIWRGFTDLHQLGLISTRPALIAAEPYPAYSQVSDPERPPRFPERKSVAFNVGTGWPTFQGTLALRASGGFAVAISDEETLDAQLLLASAEGMFVEPSSAIAVAAARRLREQGFLQATTTAVVLLTSSGLKDPSAVADRLPPVPVIEPTIDAVVRALGETG